MTNQKLAVMTAYDYPSGTFADRAGSDIVLVGDSLGMVCLGYESTNLVTLSVLSPIDANAGYDSSFTSCTSFIKDFIYGY
jgi:ketopantoate hydroxymethyltransferase